MIIDENNRFHIARFDILTVAQDERTTFDVAAMLWARSTGQTDFLDELIEWSRFLLWMEQASTPEQNLLQEYFTPEQPHPDPGPED